MAGQSLGGRRKTSETRNEKRRLAGRAGRGSVTPNTPLSETRTLPGSFMSQFSVVRFPLSLYHYLSYLPNGKANN